MRKLFYPRMALSNLKLNRRFCAPYLLTVALSCAMYYNICFVQNNRGIERIGGPTTSMILSTILQMGTAVLAIFSVIFLFYTNSLLIKQRKRELGLYSVLGMQKRNIARVLLWESMAVTGLGIVLGLAVGILLSKLVLLVLCAVMRFEVPLGFEINLSSIAQSVALFGVIGVVNLFSSLIHVSRVSPIELMRGSNVGEREPKANWFTALLGVIALGTGYIMAIVVKNPVEAITFFFFAVILVILGTYCLFISGSIAMLRILRRNKRFYYQLKHFTAVSGMMYRMRQNAAGLASICILCTMVLVIFSTTVSLNIGMEDALLERYPYDISVETGEFLDGTTAEGRRSAEEAREIVDSLLLEKGLEAQNAVAYYYLRTGGWVHDGQYSVMAAPENVDTEIKYHDTVLMSAEDYYKLTGEMLRLDSHEAACQISEERMPGEEIVVNGKTFAVAKRIEISFGWEKAYVDGNEVQVFVLNTWEDIQGLIQNGVEDRQFYRHWRYGFDLGLSESETKALYETIRERARLERAEADGSVVRYNGLTIECRDAEKNEFYSLYGGLLFIGIFLGVMFVMATAVIIYYKQISEGYDDKKRYEIMQKVGMTREEVRQTVRSQILMVFFLPLMAAVMHLLFAFPMISKMLAMFQLHNIGLFALCTGGTVLMFAVAYAVIYLLTAQMYYHIVESK